MSTTYSVFTVEIAIVKCSRSNIWKYHWNSERFQIARFTSRDSGDSGDSRDTVEIFRQ